MGVLRSDQGSTSDLLLAAELAGDVVADRVLFMDEGRILEEGEPKAFFRSPKSERSRAFVASVLHETF